MTDLLQDFEAYFISTGLVSPVYRDTMLDTPDTAVAVYEYSGANGIAQVAGVDRSIQVVARDKSATAAKELARQLYNSLVTEDGIINLTTDRWCLIHLRQVPFKMKVDSMNRTYYCFNLGVTTYND